jgi:hypothetical protein
MTKTELLALAERLHVAFMCADIDAAFEAEELCRKLAALKPVAFHDKDQPEGIAWCPGFPGVLRDITGLYNLTGIIDHE